MILSRAEALQQRTDYRASVSPWADERVRRTQAGLKDPIADFLFEYYSFPPGKLRRWSPGLGVVLSDTTPERTDEPKCYIAVPDGCTLDPSRFPEQRIPYLKWAVSYLDAVQNREPFYGCFGLHEWAMVFRTDDVRHGRIPLRLGADGTDAVVESRPIRCTHYDAFRFFSPAGKPLNRTELTRDNSTEHDQPACIHAVMDLYKFCYKIAPYGSSRLLAEAFLLALDCRTVDMRASPYDLTQYALTPIRIETREGRDEYATEQRRLAEAGRRVRDAVLGEYRMLLDHVEATMQTRLTPSMRR